MAWQWQNFMAPLIYIKGKFLVEAVEYIYIYICVCVYIYIYIYIYIFLIEGSWKLWQLLMVTKKLLYWHAFIPVKKKFMVLSQKKKKKKSEEEEACGWNARGKSAFLRFFLACFSFNLK